METAELKVQIRQEAGKGPARRLRSAGSIPAIFYGQKTQALMLAVKTAELTKLLRGGDDNVFIRLSFDEAGPGREKLVMIKEMQTNPTTGRLRHVDFYEISMDQAFTFDVPLHFSGIPVGVENGGDLQHLKREIKVSCLPALLPEAITVDIRNIEIGDALKIADLVIPEGVTVLDHADVAVVAVSAKKEVKVVAPEEEEEAAKEPERIGGEKKAREE
jgi:large subunit ribosomal protein L25